MKLCWHIARNQSIPSLSALSALTIFGCAISTPTQQRSARGENPPGFAHDIESIVSKFCIECHGAENREADLDLRTVASILSGGESGPAIVPGDPGQSILLDMISSELMPPDGEMPTPIEIDKVRQWIAAGAAL